MAENRKPEFILLLRKEGKNKANKIEFFPAKLWDEEIRFTPKFRIRVNGKWFPNKEKRFYYRTELRDMVWREISKGMI